MKEKLFLMLRNDKTKFILFVVSLVLGSYFIINEIFFIVFSILIISSIATYIHELGHYSVARIWLCSTILYCWNKTNRIEKI